MRRKLLTGAVLFALAAPAMAAERVDVWVRLTAPPVADGAGRLQAIEQQQDDVLSALKALGAEELGRVSLALNALAITIDADKLPQARRIEGVRSISPVHHIEREPVPHPLPLR